MTHRPPKVDVCNKRYVFNAFAPGDDAIQLKFDPYGECPAYEVPPEIAQAVRKKQRRDDQEFEQLVSQGVETAPIKLAPRRVNAVSPGFVATPWYDHISQAEFDAAEAFAAARLPVGRIGRASDVAQALLYVVANGFVTGSVIECDGGARVSNDTPETGLPK